MDNRDSQHHMIHTSHENHDHHENHNHHSGHAHHHGNFKAKFFVSLIFAIPIILLSPMMGVKLPFQFTFPGSESVSYTHLTLPTTPYV